MTESTIHRFRVELRDIDPLIWRQFEIDAAGTFWELHVAIQDAMGWLDGHLHAFRFEDDGVGAEMLIGIPDPDPFPGSLPVVPGRDVELATHFRRPGDRMVYDYDFGDGWEHDLVLEAIEPRKPKVRYPRCLDGARACPPEDCGGPGGYDELLEVIADPKDPEHASTMQWLGRPFDPEAFDPKLVTFTDPKKRWDEVFG